MYFVWKQKTKKNCKKQIIEDIFLDENKLRKFVLVRETKVYPLQMNVRYYPTNGSFKMLLSLGISLK